MYALLFTGLALETAEESTSNLALVLPETSELIAGVIAFAIVFFFVWKWAFPAINRILEDRQKAIQGQLNEAENAKREAETLLADYRSQLAGAKSEAQEIINGARLSGEGLKAEIVGKAQGQADELLIKARESAAGERDRALQEARNEVANLSIDLAEKVVGANLDRETQLGVVERYLAELEK